jgi:hypothetical protein
VKRLSSRQRALLAALVAFLIGSFLLTPLSGLETRPTSKVTALGAASLGVFFVGVVLAVVAVVFLLQGRASAPMIAVMGAVLFLPGLLADRTGNLSQVEAPTAIFWVEWVQLCITAIVVVLSLLVWGGREGGAHSE